MKEEKFSGYKVAFGCFILMFINLGLLGSTGVFIPHIANDLGVAPTELGLLVTFSTGGAFIFSLFAPQVLSKLNAKRTLMIATVINGLHFLLFSVSKAPWMIFLGGFMGGAVLAYGSNLTCSTILSNWFIEKRGSVIGLVFGGAGFGSAFALFMAGILIDKVGWRTTYLIFALALMAIGLLAASILIKETPEEVGQKPLGYENALLEAKEEEEKEGLELEEAKKTPTYWMWMLGIFLSSMLITGLITYLPSYWQSFGMEALKSSSYTSMISLIGAGMTLVSGIIADRKGVSTYLSYTLISYMIGMALLVLFPNPSTFILLLMVFFIALAYPSNSNYPATITTAAFGDKDYTNINSNLQTMVFLGKALLPILVLLLGKFGFSLRQIYVLEIVFAMSAFVLLILGLYRAPIREEDKGLSYKEEM